MMGKLQIIHTDGEDLKKTGSAASLKAIAAALGVPLDVIVG
jgi:hypothetical protein